mmetsp:Transcript_101788/g.206805  ORF Transcript_101788/g.206805 Transcript_101788/m.206805 type:complete len:225 (-) Transcript_101788:474-1148(-)
MNIDFDASDEVTDGREPSVVENENENDEAADDIVTSVNDAGSTHKSASEAAATQDEEQVEDVILAKNAAADGIEEVNGEDDAPEPIETTNDGNFADVRDSNAVKDKSVPVEEGKPDEVPDNATAADSSEGVYDAPESIDTANDVDAADDEDANPVKDEGRTVEKEHESVPAVDQDSSSKVADADKVQKITEDDKKQGHEASFLDVDVEVPGKLNSFLAGKTADE